MSTSADIMLQLRLLLHTMSLTLTRIHVPAPAPAPTPTPIPTHIPFAITTPTPIPISTHIHIPITTRTLTLNNILTSVPLPLAPIRPHHGIPPHLSLLAGSCHRLHRHKEPTSIKGLLHAAL